MVVVALKIVLVDAFWDRQWWIPRLRSLDCYFMDVFVLDGYICSFAFNFWLLRSHRSSVNSVSIIVFLD